MARFVGYYRVSTQRQGTSGLGLDAQRTAVNAYITSVGGELVAHFKEVESGAIAARPELANALRACHHQKAMLVVAKLDRLARNVSFISELLDSGVEFVAADMPHANKLTIHIIAAIAEHERAMISARTKEGLAAAKRKGIKLGNPRIKEQQPKATEAARRQADQVSGAIRGAFALHDKAPGVSATRLAEILNAEGIPATQGGRWSAGSVIRMRARLLRLGQTEGPPR